VGRREAVGRRGGVEPRLWLGTGMLRRTVREVGNARGRSGVRIRVASAGSDKDLPFEPEVVGGWKAPNWRSMAARNCGETERGCSACAGVEGWTEVSSKSWSTVMVLNPVESVREWTCHSSNGGSLFCGEASGRRRCACG
jgi:hypothetical protein